MYTCEHLAVVNTDCHVFLYVMHSGDMYKSQIYKVLQRLAFYKGGFVSGGLNIL